MILENIKNFDLKQTFECGQCFRWNEQQNGSFEGVVGNEYITAEKKGNVIEITGTDNSEYFDLERDYEALIKSFPKEDEILAKAAVYGSGIRLLKQEPWETLISFIISANNNIPRIKKIIEEMCRLFGEKKYCGSKEFYCFPKPDVLATLGEEELAPIKSGYRAAYIIDAAKKVNSGIIELDKPYSMNDSQARDYLKQILGVGNKVADCILLFAYGKYSVFPKDVWIKRILHKLYGVEENKFDIFVEERFGDFGGFAQQYLFYYGRTFL